MANTSTRGTRGPQNWNSSLILLTASLGLVAISTGMALLAAWNSRENTRQLLRDYAAFAAWSYSQRLSEEFGESVWLTLSPIGHDAPHRGHLVPAASKLAGYRDSNLVRCHCGPGAVPATYFRVSLTTDSLDLAGPPLPAGLASSLPVIVARAARARTGSADGRAGVTSLSPRHEVAAFGSMPTEWGDTLVYGFTVDSTALAALFDDVLQRSTLLPKAVTRGRPSNSLLALEIRDTTGVLFYRSAGWPANEHDWPYVAAESLPPMRGGFIARLSVLPSAAPTLLSGGLPRTPLTLLFLVGLLGAATAVVATAQLRREGELARLRGDFVAGVSHELRTPLAQLRLFLDTLRLKRYDTPEEQDWIVGHLSRETTRMEHLVENVLAASRLDRGIRSDAPLEPLDLGHEVGEAVTAFAPLGASRRVVIDTRLPAAIGIMGEQDALRQLVLNLLDNAVKFGPPGQRVRVTVDRANGTARLSVADEGPGVPEAERVRVWEPYYRGTSEASRAVGGSGIGLAIVREVARRFGGDAQVGHAAGGGAEFSVTFPVIDRA